MIPRELLDYLEQVDFDGNGGLYLESFSWDNDELILIIEINSGTDEIENKKWKVKTQNLRKHRVDTEWGQSIKIFENHFLLSDFKEVQTTLYFSGQTSNPDRIFTELYRKHKERFGDWIPFEFYLNKGTDLVTLLCSPNGLLGQGPKDILKVYAEVIEANGLKSNYVLDRDDRGQIQRDV